MKVFSRLTESEKLELSKGVIQVSGKSKNRTALGVVDAVLTLYPNLTFEELKEVLPDRINPSADNRFKSLFAPYNPNRLYGVIQPGTLRQECLEKNFDISTTHFSGQGETFKTVDGTEVLVSRVWQDEDSLTKENDLQNLINHVAKYGIRVVQVDKNTPFRRGEYNLDVINPILFDKIKLYSGLPQNKSLIHYKWLYFTFAIILFLLGIYLLVIQFKN